MTLHQLQNILIAYEMSIGNNASSSKETTFKAEKKEDSDYDMSDAFQALVVGKLGNKYKHMLSFKCFNYRKL